MKKAREFRAAPAKVLNQAPFIIAPIMRQSINQCPPILASDVRASERKAFNEKLAEQEREKEKLQQLEEEQRKKEEAVEVELMRKDMVFHAQPIMQGSTTPPHPFSGSVLPLTKPQSPKLQTKMRADLTSRGSNGSQMEYKNSAQNQIQVHFADLSKFLKNPEDDEPVVTNDEVEIKIELIGSNDVTEAKIE
ncbi:MAG: hypothetical protein EZS28_002802 [Streblomastix strix]|uniref:TPX2 C-terminal domain-containing protein n=1 Tax=Streblomastix strix TaxID=222440 RepID=A0A5J4X366_9EUKA|nr:MAG: hypothetical protein EZS28_002802 [Streblomastix strix]